MVNKKRVIIYMVFTILWVLGVGNLLEIGENMRFRWLVDPFAIVLCAIVVWSINNKRKRNNA